MSENTMPTEELLHVRWYTATAALAPQTAPGTDPARRRQCRGGGARFLELVDVVTPDPGTAGTGGAASAAGRPGRRAHSAMPPLREGHLSEPGAGPRAGTLPEGVAG